MSQTYTVQDALIVVRQTIPGEISTNLSSILCDRAVSLIWNAADWKNSLVSLPPFYLTPGIQDYTIPMAVVPLDFLGLRTGWLIDLTTSPAQYLEPPLVVKKDLTRTSVEDGRPEFICFDPAIAGYRIYPRYSRGVSAADIMVELIYKKKHAKITSANIGTEFVPVDDSYFDHFCNVLTWCFSSALKHPGAGGAVTDRFVNVQYTGAFAVAMNSIEDMKQKEAGLLGDYTVAPAHPLAL